MPGSEAQVLVFPMLRVNGQVVEDWQYVLRSFDLSISSQSTSSEDIVDIEVPSTLRCEHITTGMDPVYAFVVPVAAESIRFSFSGTLDVQSTGKPLRLSDTTVLHIDTVSKHVHVRILVRTLSTG